MNLQLASINPVNGIAVVARRMPSREEAGRLKRCKRVFWLFVMCIHVASSLTFVVLCETLVQFVSFGSFLQILGAMLGHRVGVIGTDTPCFCTGSCTAPGVHKRECKCDTISSIVSRSS